MDIGDKLVRLNNETILNSIADGVVVMGLDRRVLFVNRAANEILKKVGIEKLGPGQRCNKALGHSGCSLSCIMNSAIKSGEHVYNYEAKLGNGKHTIALNINASLLRDENGEVIGGIEIFRDVSLIKELKDELKYKYAFDSIVGKNYRMHEVYKLLHEVAPTKTTVLVEGESGTGKELIANAIHHNSTRSSGPFVRLNCAALSDNLLESELFGHVKGAFTGALADKPGRFELAHGGTLFLDEIGDISQKTQVKLLRVLQEGEIDRVGGTRTIKVDVRVVAATNKDLKGAVKKGEFREDLYYRLNVVPIHLPPMRDRKDDIPALVKHFIKKFNKEMGKTIINISPLVTEMLMEYHYPGNIRELENIIEHAFVRCQDESIGPEHLPKEIRKEIEAEDLVNRAMQSSEPIRELEKEAILKALAETGWRYPDTAKRLGMSRTTLWRRMKEFNMKKP